MQLQELICFAQSFLGSFNCPCIQFLCINSSLFILCNHIIKNCPWYLSFKKCEWCCTSNKFVSLVWSLQFFSRNYEQLLNSQNEKSHKVIIKCSSLSQTYESNRRVDHTAVGLLLQFVCRAWWMTFNVDLQMKPPTNVRTSKH